MASAEHDPGPLEECVRSIIEKEQPGHNVESIIDPVATWGSVYTDAEAHLLKLSRGTANALLEVAREIDKR